MIIVFSFVSFCVYLDYKVKAIKAGSKTGDPELAAVNKKLHAKTQDLEERVQVLESIVTDKKFSLKQAIETL
jgi:hypothetical protein